MSNPLDFNQVTPPEPIRTEEEREEDKLAALMAYSDAVHSFKVIKATLEMAETRLLMEMEHTESVAGTTTHIIGSNSVKIAQYMTTSCTDIAALKSAMSYTKEAAALVVPDKPYFSLSGLKNAMEQNLISPVLQETIDDLLVVKPKKPTITVEVGAPD